MISVCIPTYNGERFIYKQINSILIQLSEKDEIIISDDSSTDKTISIIKQFNDKRIKIFEDNRFMSPVFNLENALKKAKGNIIFLADQDDIWFENKVSIMLDALKSSDLAMSNFLIINSKNKIHQKINFYRRKTPSSILLRNIYKNPYRGACMAFKKDLIPFILPFPKKIMHDAWIGNITQLKNKKIKYINQPLVYYRRHDTNNSQMGTSSNSLFFKLRYRFYLIIRLLLRMSNIC